MKKSLLFFSMAAFALCANAQAVAVMATSADFEAAGLSSSKTNIPGGTLLVENPEYGAFYLAYDDSWGTTTIYKNYRYVTFDGGDVITLGSGAVGNTNPTFTYYEDGVMSGGAVFKITAPKSGYMTVFTKINPNKQYLVFEGTKGCLSFTLGWTDGTDKIYYTTPHDDEEQINFDAPDASKYFVAGTVQQTNADGVKLWFNKTNPDDIVAADAKPSDDYQALMKDIPGTHKPQFPYLVAGMEKAPGESTGFLTFSVYEGNDYFISALGSKAAMGGFIFTENQPTIAMSTSEDMADAVEFKGGSAAVETVSVAPEFDENAPIYNTQGVRVGADAKGILIQNGKKIVRF